MQRVEAPSRHVFGPPGAPPSRHAPLSAPRYSSARPLSHSRHLSEQQSHHGE